MLKLIIPLFLLLTLNVSAQYEKIDSLNYSIDKDSPDSVIFKAYLELSDLYNAIDYDSSLLYGQMAYDVAAKYNSEPDKLEARHTMGVTYFHKGELENGLESLTEAMEICQNLGDKEKIGIITNWVGLIYWKRSDYSEAIKYFQEAYDIAKEIGDEENRLYIVNNLGTICLETDRYEEADKYFKEVIEISKKIDSQEGLGLAYANSGLLYIELDSFDIALENLLNAIDIFKRLKNFSYLAHTYGFIANALEGKGEFQESIIQADKGIRLSREQNMHDAELQCLKVKANSLLSMRKNDAAIKLAKEGLLIAKRIDFPKEHIHLLKILADASGGLNKYKEAYQWQKQYIEIKDSVFTQEKQNEISELEIQFQSKQKDIENEQLKSEKESQALIIQQQTRMSFAYSAILGLLGILLFLVYRAKKKTKSINELLSKKVKERTDELEAMNLELVQTNEELKRFAFISSHDLKEPLRNVGSFITLIKKRLKEEKYDNLLEYIDYVEKGNFQLDKLVDSIRVYFKKGFFSSENIELIDLNESMKSTISTMSGEIKKRNAKVVFDPLPKVNYNPFIINILFQKLIENGIKYNQSNIPIIRVYHQLFNDHLKIIISDNGLGIAPEYQDKIFDLFVRLHDRQKYNGSGMGLAFCKKLLLNNNGSITVKSTEGKGSQFIISLPVDIVNAVSNQELSNVTQKSPKLTN